LKKVIGAWNAIRALSVGPPTRQLAGPDHPVKEESMKTLRRLNLADLKLGLDDLMGTKRQKALVLSPLGGAYAAPLTAKHAAISALPAALTGKPLSDELTDADELHDAYGSAAILYIDAALRVPGLPTAQVDALRRIKAFLPRNEDLQASYADEAAAAKKRRETLDADAELQADLKALPVVGGGTLLDWVNAHLEAGVRLGALLSARADADSGARSKASALRSQTVALLNRARGAILDAMEADASLPRDLDGQIFGYFDELEERRTAAAQAAKSAAKAREKAKAEAQAKADAGAKTDGTTPPAATTSTPNK
jgi:hypothetical protein